MSEQSTADGSDGSDEAMLDALMGRFVADLAAGRAVDPETALPERPDLLDRVREVFAIARDVAPRRGAPALPVVAGHEILRELGRGGMGAVYLAIDRDLKRRVALKVIPRAWASAKGRERFLREARAIARLRHPNVVTVFDVGEEDGAPWFTMEWIEGCTLADEMDALRAGGPAARLGPQHVRRAAAIALDLAGALDHAHGQGVVHRDVKPTNVMVRTNNDVVLFDFGLASADDELTLTREGAFLGTPQYASPEQAAGRTDIDGRTDVWALGALLHELLTLVPAFSGGSAREILRRVENDEPAPPSSVNPHVPPDLAAIVARALTKDRALRYGSARRLAEDLSRFLRGERAEAARSGTDAADAHRAKAAAALERTSREMGAVLAGSPRQLAALRSTLARSYADLGMPVEARAQTAEELAILERTNGPAASETVRALAEYARLTREAGDSEGGVRLAREAVARAQSLPQGDRGRLRAELSLGVTLVELGAADEAEPLLTHVYESTPQGDGADEVSALCARHNLALLRLAQSRPAEAAEMFREVAARRSEVLGPTDRETLEALAGLVVGERRSAGAAAAFPTSERLVTLAREAHGSTSTMTAIALHNHGRILIDLGRLDEAEATVREAFETQSRVSGAASVDAQCAAAVLADVLRERGEVQRAIELARSSMELLCAAIGPARAPSISSRRILAECLAAGGRIAEAEAVLEEGIAAIGPDELRAGATAAELAETLATIYETASRPEDAARVRATLPPA
jgi:tetratricopeptide (TPR) repeat protein